MPGHLRAAGLHNVDARERPPSPGQHHNDQRGGTVIDTHGVGVFLGLDVGKSTHHGHGLTPAGKKVFDKPLPDSEPMLRAVFDKLRTKFGTVLVVVDQPASRILIERLRKKPEGAAGALAAADESLSRLMIARETVAEVLDAESDQLIDVGVAPGAAVRGAGRDGIRPGLSFGCSRRPLEGGRVRL
jgi:hypothetical protein